MVTEPSDYRSNFCRRLKRKRLEAGYATQKAIALELGISANRYSTWETRVLAPHHMLPRLCEALDCSAWFILTGQSWHFAPPIDFETRETSSTCYDGIHGGDRLYAVTALGLCYLDTELRYRYINDTLAEMNGLAVEDHLGKTIHEVLKDVAIYAEPQLQQVLDTGMPIVAGEIEAETPADPGKVHRFKHTYYPDKKDGIVVGVSCVVQDITKHHRIR